MYPLGHIQLNCMDVLECMRHNLGNNDSEKTSWNILSTTNDSEKTLWNILSTTNDSEKTLWNILSTRNYSEKTF